MPRSSTIADLQKKVSTNPKLLTVAEVGQLTKLREIQDGANPSRFVVHGRRQVADFFGRSLERVDEWVRSGMPRQGDAYDLSAVAQWRLSKRGGEALATGTDAGEEKRERIKLIRSRRLATDQARRIKAGQYIDLEDARADIMRKLYAIKYGLQALGRRLSRELVNVPNAETVRQRIDAETRELLFAFADGWEPTEAEAEAGVIPKHEDAQSSAGVGGEKIVSVEKE